MSWDNDGRSTMLNKVPPSLNIESCENDEFQCQDNQCIPVTQVCDGINQCSGGADEHNCGMSFSEKYMEK